MSKNPSQAQIKILQFLTQDGASICTWLGGRDTYLDLQLNNARNNDLRISPTTLLILYNNGYIKPTEQTWRETKYTITDKGREALATVKEQADGLHN